MLVVAPGLLLSFLALVSSGVGGVVGGAARGVVGADAGNIVQRAVGAESSAPTVTPVPGALFKGNVHQRLGWGTNREQLM